MDKTIELELPVRDVAILAQVCDLARQTGNMEVAREAIRLHDVLVAKVREVQGEAEPAAS